MSPTFCKRPLIAPTFVLFGLGCGIEDLTVWLPPGKPTPERRLRPSAREPRSGSASTSCTGLV